MIKGTQTLYEKVNHYICESHPSSDAPFILPSKREDKKGKEAQVISYDHSIFHILQ
jgi:hypothetical protein